MPITLEKQLNKLPSVWKLVPDSEAVNEEFANKTGNIRAM